MWGTNPTPKEVSGGGGPGGASRGQPQGEFRVVERVAYAHPVRDHQVYYAPKGNNQYEQRQPPPIPPHQVGYPFFGGPGAAAGAGHGHGGGHGRARVRREHNSECVLYDAAESVVIDYVDGASASTAHNGKY